MRGVHGPLGEEIFRAMYDSPNPLLSYWRSALRTFSAPSLPDVLRFDIKNDLLLPSESSALDEIRRDIPGFIAKRLEKTKSIHASPQHTFRGQMERLSVLDTHQFDANPIRKVEQENSAFIIDPLHLRPEKRGMAWNAGSSFHEVPHYPLSIEDHGIGGSFRFPVETRPEIAPFSLLNVRKNEIMHYGDALKEEGRFGPWDVSTTHRTEHLMPFAAAGTEDLPGYAFVHEHQSSLPPHLQHVSAQPISALGPKGEPAGRKENIILYDICWVYSRCYCPTPQATSSLNFAAGAPAIEDRHHSSLSVSKEANMLSIGSQRVSLSIPRPPPLDIKTIAPVDGVHTGPEQLPPHLVMGANPAVDNSMVQSQFSASSAPPRHLSKHQLPPIEVERGLQSAPVQRGLTLDPFSEEALRLNEVASARDIVADNNVNKSRHITSSRQEIGLQEHLRPIQVQNRLGPPRTLGGGFVLHSTKLPVSYLDREQTLQSDRSGNIVVVICFLFHNAAICSVSKTASPVPAREFVLIVIDDSRLGRWPIPSDSCLLSSACYIREKATLRCSSLRGNEMRYFEIAISSCLGYES